MPAAILLGVWHEDEVTQAFVVVRKAISTASILFHQEAVGLRARHAL